MPFTDTADSWSKLCIKTKASVDLHRNDGNCFFQGGKLYKALSSFNQSLTHALPGSEEMSLAYANRSAVYFKAKFYAECLENIKKARDNGFPAHKMKQLDDCEEKCKNLILEDKKVDRFDPWSFFKLSYPANDKIPFIVNCLELRENEKYGNHVIASRNLNPGDFLSIDEPLFKMLDHHFISRRCFTCLKSNNMNLMPSPDSAVMYCSKECKENDVFHQRMPRLVAPFPVTRAQVAIPILQTLRIAGGTDELLEELLDTSKGNSTVFDLDLSDPNSKEKNMLTATLSMLSSPCESCDFSIKFDDAKRFVNLAPITKKPLTEKAKELLALCFFMVGLEQECNAERMIENNKETASSRILVPGEHFKKIGNTFGFSLMPFLSLIPCSCYPNVSSVTVDNKVALVVSRPIKAGENLAISYGNSFQCCRRKVRTTRLKKCYCEACVHDYPLFVNLRRGDRNFKEPPEPSTIQDTIEQYKINCKYIADHISSPPTRETIVMMNLNEKYLYKIAHPSNVFKKSSLH